MHLRLDIYYAIKHPQERMRELGITYQYATPQSLGDQWWFWNCENVPEELPPDLSVLDIDPMAAVGYGLSLEDAKKIRDYKKQQVTKFELFIIKHAIESDAFTGDQSSGLSGENEFDESIYCDEYPIGLSLKEYTTSMLSEIVDKLKSKIDNDCSYQDCMTNDGVVSCIELIEKLMSE